MSQLENMKIKLDINLADASKDTLLDLYLADAEEYIINGTNTATVPDKLLSTQVELAIIYYNKQGIEGESSHSEGGVSRSFEDIPESIKKKIRSCRKLPARVMT